MAQSDILKRIGRSKSWAYGNDLVPIHDAEGKQLNADAKPPFPWHQLPKPRINAGKKLWLAADIEEWFRRLEARTCQSADAFIASPKARRKVTP
ncbi:hypothetical protein B0E50_00360 [Rhodanobacter sp. C01]|nr:hypothetical protein B0E50_00360 [Rhodanobacter sp. C01]OOG58352.1 hypothetical protein B0E48_06050 [Rhodanobacter sp. C03]